MIPLFSFFSLLSWDPKSLLFFSFRSLRIGRSLEGLRRHGFGTQGSKRDAPKTTVELQWFEQLGNHENMIETGVVRANHGARSGGKIGISSRFS